jgi:hypothetical protein
VVLQEPKARGEVRAASHRGKQSTKVVLRSLAAPTVAKGGLGSYAATVPARGAQKAARSAARRSPGSDGRLERVVAAAAAVTPHAPVLRH